MTLRKFDPLTSNHPAVGKIGCVACDELFVAGDRTCIIPIGPGKDEEERERAREGRPYNAIGKLCHWACATGEE
jgi:hypothetical protein